MPRTNGTYALPPNTLAVDGDTISPTKFNTLVADLAADQNTARPIAAGGTGASDAGAARTNLGLGGALLPKLATATVTLGDLPVGNAAAAVDFLAIGTANQVLTVQSGQPAWADNVPKDGTVTTAKLANLATTAEKLAAGAVTTAKVAADAITGDKVDRPTAGEMTAGTSTAKVPVVADVATMIAERLSKRVVRYVPSSGTLVANSGFDSVTKVSTGIYRFTMSEAIASVAYAVNIGVSWAQADFRHHAVYIIENDTQFLVKVVNVNLSPVDVDNISVEVIE